MRPKAEWAIDSEPIREYESLKKIQFMSILAIHNNRRQETVSVPKFSLTVTKLDHYFCNSINAKIGYSFLKGM